MRESPGNHDTQILRPLKVRACRVLPKWASLDQGMVKGMKTIPLHSPLFRRELHMKPPKAQGHTARTLRQKD
jgi:hypothetical protein